MTLIRRPIRRETPAVIFDGGKALPIVCVMTLHGLELRQKGRRRRYLLPFEAAYHAAVKLQVDAERREKRKQRRSA